MIRRLEIRSIWPVMVQSDIKTHHLKNLASLGSEMLQNNTKTNHLQPEGFGIPGLFKRHLPQGLGLAKLFKRHPPRAFGPHTVRCANHPGRPRDETRFKQHLPSLRAQAKMEFRPAGGDTRISRGDGFALGPSKLPWGHV